MSCQLLSWCRVKQETASLIPDPGCSRMAALATREYYSLRVGLHVHVLHVQVRSTLARELRTYLHVATCR